MSRLANFLTHYFTPKVLYEIGANDPFTCEGQQVVLKPLLPNTRFFLFEAASKHMPALERSGEPFQIAVLGERDGEMKTFYESFDFPLGTGDSVYLERTDFYAPGARISVGVTTQRLDTVVARREWPLPDFIKLDVQGSELDILRGAPKCLANARALQIECSVQQYNDGAPLIHEVMAFAVSEGFRLYDIADMTRNTIDELMYCDLLFVRSELFKDRWLSLPTSATAL